MAKLAFNFNIAAAIEAMAESFTLAEKNGIPRAKIAELLSETLFSGVVYKGYGDLIAHHSYQPAGIRLMLGWKFIRLVLQTAAGKLDSHADRIVIARSSAISNIKGPR